LLPTRAPGNALTAVPFSLFPVCARRERLVLLGLPLLV
jgi:hypothetical protein